MEKSQKLVQEDDFQLTAPPDPMSEVFLQAVLEDMVHPQPKRPLQCVTVKMPLPAYLRMKRAAQKWNLTYTDVINFCTQRVVPILESPSGQVATMMEQHRVEGEQKKAQRSLRLKARRASPNTLFDLY
jgi:hypothetical protein